MLLDPGLIPLRRSVMFNYSVLYVAQDASADEHQVENVRELLDRSNTPEIANNNHEADLVEISPESADNGKSKSESILDIVEALMKKKSTTEIACSAKVSEKLGQFPCALCNNINQTRLAALLHLRSAHSISAHDETDSTYSSLQIPDFFIPHKDNENTIETSGNGKTISPDPISTVTSPSTSRPLEPNFRNITYLPSTLRENKFGKKSKLRLHCSICNQLQLSEFDLRMHIQRVHRIVPTNAEDSEKEIPSNPVIKIIANIKGSLSGIISI